MCKLKTVLGINVGLFALLALAHICRLLWGWEVQVAGWRVPLWVNGLFLVLAGVLIYLNGKQVWGKQ